MSAKRFNWLVVAILSASAGCRQRSLPACVPVPADNEYMDLLATGTLSITVPYLKSGGYTASLNSAHESGGTITGSGSDLIGFQVSRYALEGRSDGRVRLKFQSAQTTRDGRVSAETKAPELPFSLPRGYRYIRLIYFVRSSRADHNMAIAAGKDMAELNDFTKQMRANPKVCEAPGAVSCVWVPIGVAVRAE